VGSQLEYVDGKRDPDYVVTLDRRRFSTLRRAFALYRSGVVNAVRVTSSWR
jgi:hypothetical protein